MAHYAVRRLGMAPCTEAEINVVRKREKLQAAGDKEGLKKLDEQIEKAKAAKAKAKAKDDDKTTADPTGTEGGDE